MSTLPASTPAHGHDVSDRLEEAILVLSGGHAACLDGWMLQQVMFDLRRAHPDASYLQHVVGAPGEPKEALGVLAVLVPGPNPMSADRVLRLFVAVPIEGTGRIAAHDEVAQLAGRNGLVVFVDQTCLVPRH